MSATTTPAEAGRALFADYPQVTRQDPGGRSMILGVPDGGDGQYFTLSVRDKAPFITVSRWHETVVANLDDGAPEWAADVVTRGIPLPRDGALYGWIDCGRVAALIAFYVRWTPEYPLPSWSPMPEADAAEWPPFVGEHLAGPWLWEHYHAGRLVDLRSLIGSSEGVVFWVDTVASLGFGCTAVAADLAGGGIVLPRGRYAYYKTLSSGVPLPSLDDLLADESRVDLGPRFPLDAE